MSCATRLRELVPITAPSGNDASVIVPECLEEEKTTVSYGLSLCMTAAMAIPATGEGRCLSGALAVSYRIVAQTQAPGDTTDDMSRLSNSQCDSQYKVADVEVEGEWGNTR